MKQLIESSGQNKKDVGWIYRQLQDVHKMDGQLRDLVWKFNSLFDPLTAMIKRTEDKEDVAELKKVYGFLGKAMEGVNASLTGTAHSSSILYELARESDSSKDEQ